MQSSNSETAMPDPILTAEELSRALIANLPGGAAFVVDRDLRYLLAEGEALATTGFKPEDFVGKTIFEVLPPDLAANYEPMYRKALAGEPFEHEHHAHNHWYISRGTPLRAENGEVYAVLAVSYDISERKRAEDERKRREANPAFLAAIAHDCSRLSTADEIMQTVGAKIGAYLEVTTCNFTDVDEAHDQVTVHHGWSSPTVPSTVGTFRISQYFSQEFLQASRAGKTVVICNTQTDPRTDAAVYAALNMYSLVTVPFHWNGQWTHYIAICHSQPRNWREDEIQLIEEISNRIFPRLERARAEAALRKSEEKYRSLFEAINDAFALLEVLYNDDNQPVDCRFLEVSPSFEVHTGLTEAQGKTLKDLIPSIEPDWFEYYHQALVTNDRVHIEMLQAYLNIWFEVDVFPYGNPQDRRVTIVFRNINDRKQAKANQIQLIREQAAREQEHQRAEALAELDCAKTAFFSNISHEFRTPLTLILAPLQDALRNLEEWESGRAGDEPLPPLPPSLKHNLQLVHRNSLRLLKLVNTLLDFSRIEAGRMEAVYEPTDLATYTAELSSVFRSATERAGLQLVVDCPPLPEPVFVDREMWEKIVLNLLSNAFKFTFEGVITVRLRSADGNQAILQIQDTGTGIASEHLPHLFERFYQVRGTQARTHEGSGIGLALVNELVRLQGGTIAVNSTLGEGTCFTVSLLLGTDHLPSDRLHFEGDRYPDRTLASTAMGATTYVEEAERWLPQASERVGEWESGNVNAEPSHLPTLPPSHPHVLLVDDNADMREYLTRILSEYVQVEAVADGAMALAAALARVPDLILSDVMMPGLDGFELLAALRTDPRTKEVPIILLSARAGEEAIVEGLEAGADDYLIKPFSAQELVSRVTAHLQVAHLRGEALQEARNMLRRRDEFISVVSHELNTPLVSILGWTRMLRSSPPNPVMLGKALDTIERNATLQGKLVQDLLDLSRITAGKLRLNPQPIELKPVIETAIATVTQPVADKGIRFTWQETATEPVAVMGDSDRLGQVICNLLTNAIKFTPESGSITLALAVVTNDSSTDISYAEIRVTDTGIGIAAEFLPHVFDHFRQAEGANAAKGLGLGLAISRHIVELHNGTIHAESAGEGQGATFIVKLPIMKLTPPADEDGGMQAKFVQTHFASKLVK